MDNKYIHIVFVSTDFSPFCSEFRLDTRYNIVRRLPESPGEFIGLSIQLADGIHSGWVTEDSRGLLEQWLDAGYRVWLQPYQKGARWIGRDSFGQHAMWQRGIACVVYCTPSAWEVIG